MDEVAKRMAELAEKYGPQVVDAARGAVRIEAYSSLVASGLFLTVAIFLALVGRWLFRNGDERNDEIWYFGAVFCWAFASLIFFLSLWGFIDPWVYTAINNPDLYIAKKVLKL